MARTPTGRWRAADALPHRPTSLFPIPALLHSRNKFNLLYRRRLVPDEVLLRRESEDANETVHDGDDFVPGYGCVRPREFVPKFRLLSFLESRKPETVEALYAVDASVRPAPALAGDARKAGGARRSVSEVPLARCFPFYLGSPLNSQRRQKMRTVKLERKEYQVRHASAGQRQVTARAAC